MDRRSVGMIVALLIVSSPLFAQGWLALLPGTASEADVLRRYGKPENVVIRFFAFDAFETWRRVGATSTYTFEYLHSDAAFGIYEGPLGEALKVFVQFSDDKRVDEIMWQYGSGLRLHSATREQPTTITAKQIEQLLGGSPTIKKMGPAIPDGAIYRQRRDGQIIDVEYLGSGNDIRVYLSKGGKFVID